MVGSEWEKIGSALDSELQEFDKFMTGRDITGEETEGLTQAELKKIERLLEKPIEERFVQENLLKQHIQKS